MPSTENLGLPFLEAGQAQKHVTLNEALRMLDALVQLSVRDVATAPPEEPENGERYLVEEAASGGFTGKDDQVAVFEDGAWRFFAPEAGWIVFLEATGELRAFDGTAWITPRFSALQEIGLLGVGTSADETNPFAAKLNNLLFTARETGEGGSGDLRFKVNKQSSVNTASLLFQAGYSGRAEVGLTGSDDFRFKVSADGAAWRDGIVIAADTGRVSFPQGVIGLREKLTASRTYYVRPDGDDANDGLANNSGGAFATIQQAVDAVFGALDLGGHNVTIQLADGTYAAGVNQPTPQVGAGTITIQGNAAAPANVVVNVASPAAGAAIRVAGNAVLKIKDFEVGTTGAGFGLLVSAGASLTYANMRLAATAYHQIRADDGGSITCVGGSYQITGGGMAHWCAVGTGVIRCQNNAITLTGTPAFGNFAIGQLAGMMLVNGNTFSGSATGTRYYADTNTVVYVAGASATYLPGNVAGVLLTGGQYV